MAHVNGRERAVIGEIEPCRAPYWARGGHAQTLIAHFLPSPRAPEPDWIEQVELPDGDQLAVLVYEGSPGNETVVYLFHGLGGSTDSDYIQRSIRLFRSRGMAVYAVNHRGCGLGAGLAAGIYHSGRAEDLSAVIQHGRSLHPSKRHLAIGFSLSGNALLLLLSGARGDEKPDGAIAVNAPIGLERCARAMKTGLNRVYDLRFVHKVARDMRVRHAAGLMENLYRVPFWTTLHDFDNIVTAPEGGFRDREDYYESCSARNGLERIVTPTIMIAAEDDPMVGFEDYRRAELAPNVWLHTERTGGHMGYLNAGPTPLGSRRWLDYALDRFATALITVLA